MEFTTYTEVMDYLYKQLPMFSRQGDAAIKKDLTNTLKLCEVLGNPQKTFQSVHIAGTNGKGSSAHMLSAILQTAGYKTGLYTSPHLVDYRERIRINGQMISKAEVIDFCNLIYPSLEEIKPSFFELSVVMAFYLFSRKNLDIAIIETGLGGRLDSTNVIIPEVALITNIGLDHMQILGDSLPEIAAEKAGIIKPNIPVVISEKQAETSPVFDAIAQQQNSAIHYASDIRNGRLITRGISGATAEVTHLENKETERFKMDLLGQYQIKNVLGVLSVIDILKQRGFLITGDHIRGGLSSVRARTHLSGRWQLIKRNPTIICDTGHNGPGWLEITQHLKRSTYKTLHMVIGAMHDKDIATLLTLLPDNAYYYFCSPRFERALPHVELKRLANASGLHGQSYSSVQEAVKAAVAHGNKKDLIFIGGSSFVVAEALEYFSLDSDMLLD